jgi:transcriptional regulator of acetoin/glycerol metabolism
VAAHAPPRHADRVQAAVASSQAANSALVASWRRSSGLHRLDPMQHRPPQRLSEVELRQVRERAEPLALAARSSLDRLYQAVGGVGCCVLLADSDGVPIDRRGAPADDETFHDWGLWPGALWGESSEGTNGIGTCLVEQRALTIHRDQHFFSRNTLLSCTAAPIHDHAGVVAGVLDVSSCRADLTEAFAQLISLAVLDATRRIEAEMFRAAFPGARFLLAPETEKAPAGLVAIDADDLVIGATRAARQSLGLTATCLEKPFPAADLFKAPAADHEDLRTVERSALQRALARADGNVSAAAEALGISRATLHRKLKRFGLGRAH